MSRELERARRTKNETRDRRKLLKMMPGRSVMADAPILTLVINGETTSDRIKMRDGATQFARTKHEQPENTWTDQCMRMKRLKSEADCERRDGRRLVCPSFFDFIQAFAGMRLNKGIKTGASPIELYKNLLYTGLCVLYQCMLEYYKDTDMKPPDNWKHLEMIGQKKINKPETLADFRWLGKSEVLQNHKNCSIE